MSDELVVCEATAAIVWHLRELRGGPFSPTEHSKPRPKALCGIEIAWDTRLPINAATCGLCLRKAKALGLTPR